MFAFLIFEVINIGTSVLCSQYLGAKLQQKMIQVVGVSLLLNLVVGLLVSAILHFGAVTLLDWMGLRPELLQYGIGYMEIVGAFAFFQAISLTISASLRSANKAIYPMLVTVLVNIMNIVGNYILIFGKFGFPAMGAECRGCRHFHFYRTWSQHGGTVRDTLQKTYIQIPSCSFQTFPVDRA